MEATGKKKRGRKPKPDALTVAQRFSRYVAKLRSEGMRRVVLAVPERDVDDIRVAASLLRAMNRLNKAGQIDYACDLHVAIVALHDMISAPNRILRGKAEGDLEERLEGMVRHLSAEDRVELARMLE